jgi:WD40 repeat protein
MKEREGVAAVAAGENPYQGLHAFGEEDAHYFFGREADSEGLWETAQKQPFVVLLGASGSGKSSVARAGVLPRARAAGWAIVTFRPEADPFRTLAAGLVATMEAGMSKADQLIETRKLAAAFREGTLPLPDVLSTLKQEISAGRVLLLGDQFEELYTLCPDPAERQGFVDLLLKAVAGAPSGCLLLTMRADFLGRALGYRPLADALQARQVVLGPMTREELERAIEEPAALLDVTFEPGLVTRILDDVEAAPGGLPLLQFALTEMWERQIPRTGRETLPLPDGVYGELRASLLACGPFDDDRELHAIFADPRLHPWRERAPQAGDAGRRVEATIAALHGHYDGAQKPALALLLEVLRDRTDPDDSCHGRLAGLVEQLNGTPGKPEGGLLTHAAYEAIGEVEGALAGHADRVFAALEPEAQVQARRLFVQLVQPGAGTEDTRRMAARSDLGNVPWELVARLAGERLVVTGQDATQEERVEVTHEALIQRWGRLQEWMDEDRIFRAWQERLRATLHQYETTKGDKDAMLRGTALAEATEWLEQRADSLSERERAFIKESGEVARSHRWQQITGIVLAVVVIVGTAVAFGLFQREARLKQEALSGQIDQLEATRRREQAVAVTSAAISQAEQTRAADMIATADAAESLAQRASTLAGAQRLVSQGQALFAQDPILGLVVGLEGLVLAADIQQGEQVLADSRSRELLFGPGRLAFLGPDVQTVELVPGENRLVVDHASRPDELRDATTGTLVTTLSGEVEQWAFGPDGSWLLIDYDEAPGELRSTSEGAIIARLPGAVEAWQFSPAGPWLLLDITNAPGELRDAADGTLISYLTGDVQEWEFSPDSDRLLVDYEDEPGELRDGADGALITSLNDRLSSWEFSPNRSRFTVEYRGDSRSELRDAATGAHIAFVPGVGEFSARGRWLLNSDGEIRTTDDGVPVTLPEEMFDGWSLYGWSTSADESLLLLWSHVGGYEVLRESEGNLIRMHSGDLVLPEMSPNGELMLLETLSGTVQLRDTAEFSLIKEFDREADSWEFGEGGVWLYIYYGEDDRGELLDGQDGSVITTLTSRVDWSSLSPDGDRAVIEYAYGPTELRSVPDAELVSTLSNMGIEGGKFSPDGARLLVDRGGRGELVDADDGSLVAELSGNVRESLFSPSGRWVAINYTDGPPEIRDAVTGSAAARLQEGVAAWRFSPGERWLVVDYAGGRSDLWHTGDGLMAASLGENVAQSLFIGPTGKLAVRYLDGRAFLLDLAWLEAMQGEAGTLAIEEMIELACEYPLDNGAVLERPDIRAALQPYLEAVGLEEPQACKGVGE